jgi:ankyrin repeat protein
MGGLRVPARVDEVRRRLKHGVDIEAQCCSIRGGSALVYAAAESDPESIELLLSHGANTEATCFAGKTPLMWAVQNNCSEAVSALLAAGADVLAKRVVSAKNLAARASPQLQQQLEAALTPAALAAAAEKRAVRARARSNSSSSSRHVQAIQQQQAQFTEFFSGAYSKACIHTNVLLSFSLLSCV